jgi:hypothetical protein
MRLLVDMTGRRDVAAIDWEFLYEVKNAAGDLVEHDRIRVNSELIRKIPAKWAAVKDALRTALGDHEEIWVAVSDVEIKGNDYIVEGTLQGRDGSVLDFHKLEVLDDDLFEDDFIGKVVTTAGGAFRLAFDSETFNDIPWIRTKSMPDFIFRVYEWKGDRFELIHKFKPKPLKVTKFEGDRMVVEFGAVTVDPAAKKSK